MHRAANEVSPRGRDLQEIVRVLSGIEDQLTNRVAERLLAALRSEKETLTQILALTATLKASAEIELRGER